MAEQIMCECEFIVIFEDNHGQNPVRLLCGGVWIPFVPQPNMTFHVAGLQVEAADVVWIIYNKARFDPTPDETLGLFEISCHTMRAQNPMKTAQLYMDYGWQIDGDEETQ